MRKPVFNTAIKMLFAISAMAIMILSGCKNEGDDIGVTGQKVTYPLSSVSDPAISGSVTFEELSDNTTLVTIDLNGTQSGSTHPAHIHANTAAEGGGIIISLESVDGASGTSETTVTKKDDESIIYYDELINFDGYVNVHLSAAELSTIVAQGDIGQNALTGEMEDYQLTVFSDPEGLEGKFTIYERVNGEALGIIELEGTTSGNDHPSHIHFNTAVEGGGIAISLANVNGATGMGKTNISQMDDDTPITFDQLKEFDGYVNVHLSPTVLGTIIAQGDVGQNELTGSMEMYDLFERAVAGISGYVKFEERRNEETLVTIQLENTPDDGLHPTHIHANTAAEGGGIVVSFNDVNGNTGLSRTNVTKLNDETPITFTELLDFNGYVNVHLSAAELGTIVAQGDIGQNAFTGESIEYTLEARSNPDIFGTAEFFERNNGTTLIEIILEGTTDGDSHPTHIHNNSAEEGGSIAISLTNVNGATGISRTQIAARDDATAITYDELIGFNGYINVHLSAEDLATLVGQGNIGSNVE